MKAKGLQGILRNMRIYSKKLVQDLTLEVLRATNETEKQAKLKVTWSVDIRQSIYSKMDYHTATGEIGATDFIAPYEEFGTGIRVVVPTGYESFAMQFYVNGMGRKPPRPFLIPSFLKEKEVFKKNIGQIVQQYSGLKSIKRL